MRSKGQPVRPQPAASAIAPLRPERWEVDAGERDVAQLHIPPDAKRDRSFEVFCSFQVRWNGEGEASHALQVRVNGQQAWSRRVDTDAGGRDSLDYRFRQVVPSGEALRIVATTEVRLAVRTGLRIVAEEE